METKLQKTKNWYNAIGTVYEKALTKEDCVVKLWENGKPTGEKKNAECIKGRVTIRVESGPLTFPVYFSSIGLDGKEAKTWKMAEAMYMNWLPEVFDRKKTDDPAVKKFLREKKEEAEANGVDFNVDDVVIEPTLVSISGSVEANDYVSPTTGKLSSGLRWRVSRANTRVSPDATHGMTLTATCFINGIRHEIKRGTDDEETGRLEVKLYGANNKGECFPIDMIVDEELADEFEETYEVGQTVEFDIDIVNHHYGDNGAKKRAFGHKAQVNTSSGFTRVEYVLAGADEAIEEPEELTYIDDDGKECETKTDWINPKTMKMAIKARAVKLEQMEKDGGATKSTSKSAGSFADRKAEAKKKLGTKKKVVEMDDDDDDFNDFNDDDNTSAEEDW